MKKLIPSGHLFPIVLSHFFFLFFISESVFSQPYPKGDDRNFEKNRLFIKLVNSIDFPARDYKPVGRSKNVETGIKNLDKAFNLFNVHEVKSLYKKEKLEKIPNELKEKIKNTLLIECSENEKTLLQQLKELPEIEYAERVPILFPFGTPDDPKYVDGTQWYLDTIHIEEAWQYTQGNNGIKVAVIDFSFFTGHEDLQGKFVDAFDAVAGDADVNPPDNSVSHGTKVAGLIGAVTNNTIGVAGAGYNIQMIPIKINEDASPYGSNAQAILDGIDYAVEKGARVINLSIGTPELSITQQNKLELAHSAGVVIVAACGNDNNNVPMYPAAFNFVISVANTTVGDIRYGTSSFGPGVDVAAPGGGDGPMIRFCTTGATDAYGDGSGGTSFSAPLVSAVCALMIDVNPALSPTQVEEILEKTSVNIDGLNPGYEGLLGAGRVHAGNAVKEALNYRANFSADFVNVCPNQTINLKLDSNDVSATYQWDCTGGTPSSFTGSGPFTLNYSSPGTYSISCQVTNTYGTFTLLKNNYITVANIGISLPFKEDFTGDFLSRGWSIWNGDNSYTWEKYDSINFGTGSINNTNLFVNNYMYNAVGKRDSITSPLLSLNGETDAFLRFDVAYARYDNFTADQLNVLVSNDCGQTWNSVYLKAGALLETVPPTTSLFIPKKPSEWRTEIVDLSAYLNSNILIIFENTNDYSNALHIDNIEIYSSKISPTADFIMYEKEICPTKTITVKDVSTGGANSWTWSFENGAPSSASGPGPHTVTFSSAGDFAVSMTATNAVGSNSISQNIKVTNGIKPGFLLDFEDGVFPPTDWNVSNTDSNITWMLDVNAQGYGTSTKCIKLPYFGNRRKEVYDYFFSNLIDFKDAVNPRIEFTYSYKEFSSPAPPTYDFLLIQYGEPCSFESTPYLMQFNYIWYDFDAGLSTDPGSISTEWIPSTSSHWKIKDTSLAPVTGSSRNIYLGGYDGGKTGNSIYVDDVIIKSDNYSPIKVINFTLSNPANKDVKIEWNTNYEIDNSRFLIEIKKGTTGSYVMIDSVDGLPDSRVFISYQKTELSQPANDWLYYKLSTRNIKGYVEFRVMDSIFISSPDNTPPVILLTGNDTITIFKGTTYNDLGATASDDVDGDITNKIIIVNPVNINMEGTYIITYNVSDMAGNPAQEVTRVVMVIADVIPPVITLVGNDTVNVSEGTTYNDAGATASDNKDGDLTNNIVVNNTVNTTIEGTYFVTYNVSDAAGNPAVEVKRVVIVTPYICTLIANINNKIDVNCFNGGDGEISVLANQGVSPYSYKWSDASAQITSTAINLIAGTFTVTVTDTKACTVTVSATITQPSGVTVSFSNTIHTTCGFNNGSVTAVGSDGTPGYNYSWSNSSNTPAIGGLQSGIYTVTVSDLKSCTKSANVTINPSSIFSITLNSTFATCGKSNGTATATITGGKSPFLYDWNDPNFQTTATADSLGAGSYYVTIVDANGCLKIDTALVTQPSMPTIGFDILDASCELPNGVLTAKPTGGASPYTYKWSYNNATSQTISSLLSNSYTVTVTDGNGCTVSADAIIGESSRPQGFISGVNPACAGVTNGSVNLTISGGTTPYSYAWSTGSTTEDLSAISTGTYSVTMTDSKGCTVFQTITLGAGVTVNLSVTSTNITCFGLKNGTTSSSVSGGTLPYSYSWIPVSGNTPGLSGLSAGTYTVTVTDNVGCSAEGSTVINEPNAVIADFDPVNRSVKTGDTVKFINNSSGAVSYKWNFGDGGISTETLPTHVYSGASTFTITLAVYDNNGCKSNVSIDSVSVSSTSIQNDSLIKNAIVVYPNPVNQFFIIKFPPSLINENTELLLSDMNGKLLIKALVSVTSPTNEIEIATNDLPSGVYILHINSTKFKKTFLVGKVKE